MRVKGLGYWDLRLIIEKEIAFEFIFNMKLNLRFDIKIAKF